MTSDISNLVQRHHLKAGVYNKVRLQPTTKLQLLHHRLEILSAAMSSQTLETSRPQVKGLYKLTIHARRRDDMSEEDFHHHWTHSHAPKISAFLSKYSVVGYTQYHTPSWVRAEAAEKLQTLGSFATDNTADYDGYVELRMPELECYERARKGMRAISPCWESGVLRC